MKKSRIDFVFEDAFFFACMVFLYRWFQERMGWLAFVFCILFSLIRKRRTVPVLAVLLLLASMSFYSDDVPTIQSGRVVKVGGNYAEVADGRFRVLLYTDSEILYDSVITFSGTPEAIESTPSFFGYNFEKACHARGIYYVFDADCYAVTGSRSTFRRYIQQKASLLEHGNIVKKVLLGITDSSLDKDSYFYTYGFSLTSVLYLLFFFLRFFFTEKKRYSIEILLILIFLLFYHFPLNLVQLLIFRVLNRTKLEKDESIGMGAILVLLLFPESYTHPGFLFPMLFRICGLFCKKPRQWSRFYGFCLQSLLFHSVNPVMTMAYPFLRFLSGMLYFLAFGYLFFPDSLFAFLFSFSGAILSLFMKYWLYGSMAGLGLVVYLVILSIFRKQKFFSWIACILFFVFLQCGLFHPFSEVTCISVGQGDALLIRSSFNRSNILVDTGKQSAYPQLKTYLQAKGVHTLDAVLITHYDEDHSGNLTSLQKDFTVKQVVDSHFDSKTLGRFVFQDINTVENENTNQSSLVTIMKWNGLRYLFTGDIDTETEKHLIENCPDLKADILKVAHHGSKNGTSYTLLDTIQPRMALISAGRKNRYGHPSMETKQRLLKNHISFYSTSVEGDMSILCIGPLNLFITSSLKIGIIH